MRTLAWMYFALLLVITATEIIHPEPNANWVTLVALQATAVAGVFGFLTKRKILTRTFWAVFSAVYIAWMFVVPIASAFQRDVQSAAGAAMGITIIAIILGPAALLLVSYSRSQTWNEPSVRGPEQRS